MKQITKDIIRLISFCIIFFNLTLVSMSIIYMQVTNNTINEEYVIIPLFLIITPVILAGITGDLKGISGNR